MSHVRSHRAWIGGAAAVAAVAGGLLASPAHALQGTPADQAAHSHTARIVIGNAERACTGTLVAPQWVLSAASCFADATGTVQAGAPKTATTVTVGRTDLTQASPGAAARTAVRLVPHPERDLVMVKLDTGIANLKPAVLATTPAGADEAVRAAGFGRTKTAWVPDRLHTASFTAAANGSADIALTASGDGAVCQGDAGGPVLREKNGTQELLAVISRSWQGGCLGTPATETRTGAVATRVDDVRPWIASTSYAVPGDLTGDGKPDLVAVDDAGKLRLYPGTGTGGIVAPTIIGTGGWAGASVTHRGDWNGDGMEDVVARVGNEVRVYPNLGGGTLGAPVKIAGSLPANAQVVAIGDTNRDGKPDLVVKHSNRIFLYPGVVGADAAVGAPVEIGNGGWDVMDLSALGDANKDGRPDLLARDTRDGVLWAYLGQPDGKTFGDRNEFGRAYTVTSRPLIAGAADADLDGTADMWATAGDGTLKFYRGGTDIHGPVDGPSIQVGNSGWGAVKSIS
ncbi:FG-GAP-like repeat-containing protein [Streptomyces sp. NPDC058157]|uniref:FG-GAP-like repeat-containing protein n=1 Tax=Streptomyces sp. NPDC058157 TaxID=3346360 RepID=UPI0036EEDA36